MDLTNPHPDFDFYEAGRPIYTHPRFLPNSKISEGSQFNSSIISEGCIINQAIVEHSVIGIRSRINEGSVLNHVIMLGQDNYESVERQEESAGLPMRGIGAQCQISWAIIDKNARIGDGVIIHSHQGKPNEDGDCYYVRDGIIIIPKNTVVPDGRRI
jgi:glucose-1-phosphate adenylyltransferase